MPGASLLQTLIAQIINEKTIVIFIASEADSDRVRKALITFFLR